MTTPAPGPGQGAQTTTTYYNTSLRAWKITQPDGTSLTNGYDVTACSPTPAAAGYIRWPTLTTPKAG